MTMSATGADRRGELVALWRALAGRGAVVTWHDLDALPHDVIEALCTAEARRIRALVEGEACGWAPRHLRPAPVSAADASEPVRPIPIPDHRKAKEPPMQVRSHRPAWRASA